jgi:hypothetical protein
MTDRSNDSSDLSRRRLLKTIAAGGGVLAGAKLVPDHWVKPAIESLVVPAHAQATGCVDGGTVTATFGAAAPTINLDFGFSDADGTYDTTTGVVTMDFGVPGGCTGTSTMTATVSNPAAPTGVSGTLTADYSCPGAIVCSGFVLNFTADQDQGNGVFTGTWSATGSPGCCAPID